MSKSARAILVICGATLAAALMIGLLAARDHLRKSARAGELVAASAPPFAPAPAPYRERLTYPSATAPEPPPATEAPPVPTAPRAAPARADTVPPEPPPAPSTGATWIGGYRDAVCACTTRTCVRDLQARFVTSLTATRYDEARDGEAFAEASRAAIRCYTALPENS